MLWCVGLWPSLMTRKLAGCMSGRHTATVSPNVCTSYIVFNHASARYIKVRAMLKVFSPSKSMLKVFSPSKKKERSTQIIVPGLSVNGILHDNC